MLLFSSVVQILALVLLVVGAVLVAGWGGGVLAVAADLLYVGHAIDRSQT
jgi:hypothetical protein